MAEVREKGIRFARDAELEAGSDAHYTDPGYYASTYADRDEDVDYYVSLAVERGGPVTRRPARASGNRIRPLSLIHI